VTSAHISTREGYRRISIDPVTRLEGHGKIDIFLDAEGEVADCYFQVPELRGFEKFCEGRPVEEMPRITSRICGVCPEAHLMASAKAGDAVYHLSLPKTARLLRELQYNLFYVTDHTTHFYALAAPDFVMGPSSDPASRNLIGVIRKLGVGIGAEVIKCRQWGHEAAAIFGYGYALTKEFSLGINLKYLARLGTFDTHSQSRLYQMSNENIYNGNYNINGIVGYGDCLIVNNSATSNNGDGIKTSGRNNRMEGNQANSNGGIGINSTGGPTADYIFRNTATYSVSGTNYFPASGPYIGPTTNFPNLSTSPWANF